MYWVDRPLYLIGVIYLVMMLGWAVLSWFPIAPGSAAARAQHLLRVVIEPVVRPFRKLIPPLGMFDISFMIAFLVVLVLTEYVLVRVVI
jgi:YggT family protein